MGLGEISLGEMGHLGRNGIGRNGAEPHLYVILIGVRANFSRGLNHLCPKNFSTAPEKMIC